MNINATLLGQAISFAIFVWFCMKFVWPPLTAALAERQKKIADGLNAASKAQDDLKAAQDQVAQELKAAKDQAAQLIEQANRRAGQLVEEAKSQAVVESERIKAQAREQIEQETNRARDQLRAQVAALAVAGAEKILQAEVNANAHAAMLSKLAAEL
ncbi:MAG TPA: F0F1 ATP synthase subunit B [Agitococcus sp.]|mgnify:CR=1 FL=1|jgi:F-type H+-transporting ATPase subunit b|uniref:F0F1 ATP synthase subunit B n=1 Tax=uncultured Agitococcus sp. TaxID=1506599 RepID=UPI00262CDE60|nr:F0F1 ATP synthase subunit B [uncultured Agitococcus sp.]HNH42972.1 F0F1 ATP synthase subunit B [Agitococcus sp.]HNJ85591.1 F0F1 ATP synthase subunit B [Agitococcus sp.]HRH92484.1 F0F1 ATP synthase subunit B [Agitococcus sp.]